MKNIFQISLLIILLSSCAEGGDCSKDSSAVKLAKSVTSESYEKMFGEFEELASNDDVWIIYPDNDFENIPSELRKLKPKNVKIQANYNRVILEGCFDHHVILLFEGIKNEKKRIKLIWGEGSNSGSEIVWEKANK